MFSKVYLLLNLHTLTMVLSICAYREDLGGTWCVGGIIKG